MLCDTFIFQITSRVYPQLKSLDEVLGGPSAWEHAQITDGKAICLIDGVHFPALILTLFHVASVYSLNKHPLWSAVKNQL